MKFKIFLEATKDEFIELGDSQRYGEPEKKMLAVQHIVSGGIINPVVEHCGDLAHRMTELVTFRTAGYEFVKPKVKSCLLNLTQGYGFNREFEENIKSNAKYQSLPYDEYRKTVYTALKEYGDAHAKLKTYNRAHKLAQLACIALGNRQWYKAINCLRMLESHLGSIISWVNFAHQNLDSE